jgi:16S rRNA C967 or C1407 C5-methylase (RsmB/RsmF family)/NOL1/NOP2/fmu family ribosome biogenesis protein
LHSSLPGKFLDSLNNIKGFDRKAFEAIHESEKQVVSVRLNPGKPFDIACSKLNIESSVPWCPYGKYLSERPSFTFDPLLHAGAYYVQEASSMFLWNVLEQTIGKETTGLKVLDLCAAPGGKSTLLASYFKDGLIVSDEVIKSRAAILVENITKWGSENVVVTNNDPKDFSRMQNLFDVIVVDAPCSGSGLFRKDAEAIEEWSEENVLLCSQRQQRVLAAVFPALKKNGILIYSTCSYSEEEDEGILDWMMEQLSVVNCQLSIDKAWGIIEVQSSKYKAYGYRFFPYKIKGEGFFIAAFKKNEGEESSYRSQQLTGISKQEANDLNDWIKERKNLFFFKQYENIIAIPLQWKQDLALLQKNLYIKKAGVTIGSMKGKDFIPEHGLAVSLLLNEKIPFVSLNYEQAIQYLKKKDIAVSDTQKGWNLVQYGNANLGWIKVLHNRVNNYYPTNWRILKD